jgi:hypothetical protein
MLERAVEDVECLWPFVGGTVVSSDIVLVGDPGEGGELPWEDLGVVRAESENELRRRYLGMFKAGADTSLGPSTPVLTKTFSF